MIERKMPTESQLIKVQPKLNPATPKVKTIYTIQIKMTV